MGRISIKKKNSDVVKIIGKPKTTAKEAEAIGINFSTNKWGGVVFNDDNADTRRFVEQCYRTRTAMVNPIVDWTDRDVWDFLRHYGCESNPLYQCGRHKIGCIGCPFAGKHREEEFRLYPKYKENYIKAFDRMLKRRAELGKDNKNWTCGEDVFRWWMEEDPREKMQIKIEDTI